MGTYDTLHVGSRMEQVKLWGKGLRYLHAGDVVGPPRGGLAPCGTYTVRMHTGGYVHVVDGTVEGWLDAPGAGPVVDTRGQATSVPAPGRPTSLQERRMQQVMSMDEPCPRCERPALRAVDGPTDEQQATARGLADADALLAARPSHEELVRAVRVALADDGGYLATKVAVTSRLLGLAHDRRTAGSLLVEALRDLPVGSATFDGACSLLSWEPDAFDSAHVAAALRLLAAGLPPETSAEDEAAAGPSLPRSSHPRRYVHTYGELDLQRAAERCVAWHGAPALLGLPVSFWWYDLASDALVAELLGERLGRTLDPTEVDAAIGALSDLPGHLDDATTEQLSEALSREVERRRALHW